MTLFSDRDERILENLRIHNARFLRKPRKLPVRGERPAFALGGSAPTLVIAASNSPVSTMAKADYICTGTNDHLLIASALNRLWDGEGGRILLCEGDFYLGGTTILLRGVRFEGMGREATRLHSQMSVGSSTPVNATMFHVEHTPGIGSVDPISFEHFDMDGHKSIQTAGTPDGIYCEPNGSAFISLNAVSIHDFLGTGLVSDRSGDVIAADHCTFNSNDGDGIFAEFEGDIFVSNSDLSFNTGRGMKADGANFKMNGCTVRGNGSHGFSAGGIFEATPKLLIGNEFTSNGGYGIDWDAVNGVIAGNHIEGNAQDGIIVFANHPVSVVANSIVGNTLRGATLVGGGGNQGGVFEANIVRMNGQHGIYVDSDDWLLQGNRVNNNSRTTTNTYDGIHIAGGVDVAVLTNMVRQTVGAPVQRYGINIAAGATGCWRAGNDCRGGGFGTAAYVDAGTASILVWAGGAGDNQ